MFVALDYVWDKAKENRTEEKAIFIDDGGLLCDAYQTTELGEADCTRMFIMEKPRFPIWLTERGMGAGDVAEL